MYTKYIILYLSTYIIKDLEPMSPPTMDFVAGIRTCELWTGTPVEGILNSSWKISELHGKNPSFHKWVWINTY